MKPRLLLLNGPAEKPTLRDYYCSSTSKAGYLWQPIDLICQSGFLNDDFDLTLIDAPAEGLTGQAALCRAIEMQPEVIFALIGTASYPGDLAQLERLQAETGARVFVSGDWARFYPSELLGRYPFIEGVVVDFTAPGLRDYLLGTSDRPAGLILRNGNSVLEKKPKEPFPYPLPRHSLFTGLPYRMPFLRKPFASVLTNYGCPHRCTFCNSCRIGFADRDLDNLFEELDRLHENGIRDLFVKDFTFNAKPQRAIMLLERWLSRGYRFSWIGYFRAETIDAELARLIARSGCKMAQLGIESADETVLAKAKPGANLKAAEDGIRKLRNAGVPYGAHFVFGLPGDDATSYEKTVRWSLEQGLSYASFNAYTPRPGAPSAGNSVDPWSRMDPSHAYSTTVAEWIRLANRRFYLRPGYLSVLLRNARAAGSLGSVMSMAGDFLRTRMGSRS
jgi:radical SAM superfamily enzyme YgiQ (UPF0313 family)